MTSWPTTSILVFHFNHISWNSDNCPVIVNIANIIILLHWLRQYHYYYTFIYIHKSWLHWPGFFQRDQVIGCLHQPNEATPGLASATWIQYDNPIALSPDHYFSAPSKNESGVQHWFSYLISTWSTFVNHNCITALAYLEVLDDDIKWYWAEGMIDKSCLSRN